jgi:hypothetical protein
MIDTTTAPTRHALSVHAESAAAEALRDENAMFVERRQLHSALVAAMHENARLRRALAQARAENLELRKGARLPRPPRAHHERIRTMLSDPASRNP